MLGDMFRTLADHLGGQAEKPAITIARLTGELEACREALDYARQDSEQQWYELYGGKERIGQLMHELEQTRTEADKRIRASDAVLRHMEKLDKEAESLRPRDPRYVFIRGLLAEMRRAYPLTPCGTAE